MRPDPVPLSPQQRFHQVARLLAAGVRRLLNGPQTASSDAQPLSENPQISSQNFLELSDETRLTVHTS
jgi:hypothetical protein